MNFRVLTDSSPQSNNGTVRPGRLSITCLEGKNIRDRIENERIRGGSKSPYLLFKLAAGDASMELRSEARKNRGCHSGKICEVSAAKPNLCHLSYHICFEHQLGDTLETGVIQFTLRFDPPKGLAFPQDQPTMTSYELVTSEDKKEESKLQPIDERDGVFTEDDIKKAFALFDLDKNGYIGAAELRHILIFMGEHVTDEEVDMMISMLDMNGETSLLQCGIYIIIFAPITYFCVYGRR